MSHGPISVFTKTISAGGSITSAYDLERSWPYVYLVVPPLSGSVSTATCNIYIYASSDNVNFYNVIFPPLNTSTTAIVTFVLANSVSQCVVPVPNSLRYMQIQLGNTATASVRFDLICSGD